MKTITNTDPTSSTASLKRGIIRFKQHERGYVKLDAASALAITRLAVKDMHNFARIVAADPSIIEVLLDSKKIGHGPIFTDANIWLVLAYTIPRLRALGGQTTAEFRSLTFAFENYLTFHNTDNLRGPYVEPLRWAYEGSGQKADALANSWPHFAKNIERIWTRLCPSANPERDIIDRVALADDLDNSIAAYMLNVVFSGVDLHLSKVLERRKAYNKAISRLVSTGGATPIDALKGATAGIDGGVTASAIGEVSAMILSTAGDAIANIHVSSDFKEMRHLYGRLYEALKENATSGRFIVGQRILSSSEMRAFSKSATRGPLHKEDMSSPVGDPSSIRRFLESKHDGIDRIISEQEFTDIMERRMHVGDKLQEALTNVESHNALTPPKTVRNRSEE